MPRPAFAVDPFGTGRGSFVQHLQTQKRMEKQVREALRQAATDAQRAVLGIPGDNVGSLVRKQQYKIAREAIVQTQRATWSEISTVIEGGIMDVKSDAIDGFVDLTKDISRKAGKNISDQLVASSQRSSERLAARIDSRYDLSDLVYKNNTIAMGQIDRVVNNGILLSKSAKEISLDVLKFIRPETPGGPSYAAMRLGRTELNNAFHATSTKLYASHPWVEGVKWNLSGSHPRNDICNDYAERNDHRMGPGVYEVGDTPAKPHPQCLCYIVPVTPTQEDFIENLFNGHYNNWMEDQGMDPL